MNITNKGQLIEEIVIQAHTFLKTAENYGLLKEVTTEIAVARFSLTGWWHYGDISAHLQATDTSLLDRLLAAQVEADRGHIAAGSPRTCHGNTFCTPPRFIYPAVGRATQSCIRATGLV